MQKQSKEDVFISRVEVENFPSRVELFQMLDTFIAENKYIKDYTSDNKDGMVQFIFRNPDLAYNFVKQLNLEKIKNPLYAKVKTNIQLDVKKEILHKNTNSKLKKDDNKQGIKSPNLLTSPKYEKKITNSNSVLNKDSIEDYYYDYTPKLPRGKTLRTSSPYIPESKRQFQEYVRNKEKWLSKKGFTTNVAKLDLERKSIIPNYVFVSPAKIPLHKYQFRDIHKEKWVDKKTFAYKNPSDLVL